MMKCLIIVVEGQTEETFVKEILRPYFNSLGLYEVIPIKIQTSKGHKGGFVNYQHLKNDVKQLLKRPDAVVTTFVDYFRLPTSLPNYEACMQKTQTNEKISCLEESMQQDIGNVNFIPYIQKHEFEALLFSSKTPFKKYFDEKVESEIGKIIEKYASPEEINDNPSTAPSKRLLSLIPKFDKIDDGNTIALEIGIEQILNQCPRFRNWIEVIKEKFELNIIPKS